MYTHLRLLLFLVGSITTISSIRAQEADNSSIVRSFNKELVKVSKATSPTVVSITVSMKKTDDKRLQYLEEYLKQYGKNFRADKYRSKSIGSGVLLSKDGYIVTNNHVVEDTNEDSIMVTTADGSIYLADLIGQDPSTDLAILRIYGPNFTSASLGNSDKIEVGEMVLAVGSPLGLRSTVTSGIVSAISRGEFNSKEENNDEYTIQNYIQTDAPINPGNSGGGLFNLEGQLIGVNVSIYTSTGYYLGYGFAIPSNLMKSVADDLIEDGRIDRGYLGIDAVSVDEKKAIELQLTEIKGVRIESVDSTGPAFKAGMAIDEVLLEMDGQTLPSLHDLQDMLARKRPGDIVMFKTLKEEKEHRYSVTLVKRDDNLDNESHSRSASLCILGETNDVEGAKGVEISKILRYGAAEKAGMQEKDIIIAIGTTPVATTEQLRDTLASYKPGDSTSVTLMRKGAKINKDVVLHSSR